MNFIVELYIYFDDMYIDKILFIYSLKSRKILLEMLDTLDNFITNVND